MTVRELKEQLEGVDEGLEVCVTSPEFFPVTRKVRRAGAVAVEQNWDGFVGVFAFFATQPGPMLKTKKESTRAD